MFTGIVTDCGTVLSRSTDADAHIRIRTAWDMSAVALGASIACNGICLTVVEREADWFAVDISAHTQQLTTSSGWQEGTRLNLERALRMGEELGGHLVSGHVDGLGTVSQAEHVGDSMRLSVEAPAALMPMIAVKGSIVVDGVSLTVNAVEGQRVTMNLIPHTWQHTTLGALQAGDKVNLEIDLIARYVHRLLEARA